MEIREATADDVEALLPLYRGYTDFTSVNPSDEDLEARMVRGVIGLPR